MEDVTNQSAFATVLSMAQDVI
ncbi:MAG: hypothetical protein JWL86_972, partial [Rhizobium sp.]|nr:hypothetical protein [Rhizobium sp.]